MKSGNMKIGKVFETLQANKKVESIHFAFNKSKVTLKQGYAVGGERVALCANAKEANAFVRAAKEVYVDPGMKTVINILSGKPVEIRADTPRCCDPSSELYHCM